MAEKEKSPEYILLTSGPGRASSKRIAASYSVAWLPKLSDSLNLLRLGFALYDVERYPDALTVFRELEKRENIAGVSVKSIALVWQGHMLDLLGRRREALAAYGQVAGQDLHMQHDEYGIHLTKEYIQQRIKHPFVRVENHLED